MFTVIVTTTRPNTAISWFTESTENAADAAVLASYQNDESIISMNTTFSEDNLTKTLELAFNDYSSYQAWVGKILAASPMALVNRNEYIIANGSTLKVEEIYENGDRIVEKQL